jgi:hypothetical protein
MIENLRSKGIEPEFHWVPAHIGIEGNERADKAAKEATGWRRIRNRGRSKEVDTGQTAYKPPGYSLVAAMRAVHNSLLLVEWKEAWMNEKTGRALNRICPEPTTKVLFATQVSAQSIQLANSTDAHGKDRSPAVFVSEEGAGCG